MKILIADDHDLLRDTLVMFLEGEGNIETVTASDFDGAMALVDAQGSFDLIMLDYNMPGMQGVTGLKTALAHNGGQKVALMSGIAPNLSRKRRWQRALRVLSLKHFLQSRF